MSILIVAANSSWAGPLIDSLVARDHPVTVAPDAASALELLRNQQRDAIIVGWDLPDCGCLPFCRRIRSDFPSDYSLLVVGPGDQLQNKLAAFDAGCDDFVADPFDNLEMLARLSAIVRRARSRNKVSKILQIYDLKYNTGTCEAFRADRLIRLGPICRKLLEVLMQEAPRVVTRERLEREIWGSEVPERDLLRSHMSMLRKAIDYGQSMRLIHTIHGTGFRLVDPVSN